MGKWLLSGVLGGICFWSLSTYALGDGVSTQEYPGIVSLYDGEKFVCTGSVVSLDPVTVLTAAHCLRDHSHGGLNIASTDERLVDHRKVFPVISYVPEAYDAYEYALDDYAGTVFALAASRANDIALMVYPLSVEKRFDDVAEGRVFKLARVVPALQKAELKAVGFGARPMETPQKRVHLIHQAGYLNRHFQKDLKNEHEMIYYSGASIVPGDSGGPVLRADGVIVGVIHGFHPENGQTNYVLNVSSLNIKNFLGQLENNQLGFEFEPLSIEIAEN